MADSWIQPNFRAFTFLRSDAAKGSRNPDRKVQQAEAEPARKGDAPAKRKILSISQYQDPRDELDQQRHELRQQKDENGGPASEL